MKFVLYIVLVILSTIFSGWILSWMWEWFIWSQFRTVHLTVASSIGVAAVVKYLTMDLTLLRRSDLNPLLGKPDYWTEAYSRLFADVVIGALIFGFGYIIHLFVPVLGR